MRNQSFAFPVWMTAVLMLSLIADAQAARWYRVELMAFRQSGAELSEQWAAEPQLRYPERARFLQDASTASAAENSTTVGETAVVGAETDSAADELAAETARLTSFVKLPAESREFERQANSMARSGRYRVLFHESWIQPVTSKSKALPLILERPSGDGGWPLLQGSVKLHLSRYLHLETNLWLNTNGDYLSGDWRMPSPPPSPAAYVDETTGELRAATNGQILGEASAFNEDQTGAFGDYTSAQMEPAYPYRHAVLLQQKRRMRSNEMHYIDHPMLGLVIKLTPLETDEG